MSNNRFYFSLFLLVLVLSCEENDEPGLLTYPAEYHKTGVEPVGNLRVFSSKGEIKNSSIISRFSQYDTSYFNSYADYLGNDFGVMDTVYFFTREHAMLLYEYAYHDCSLSMEGNLLVLTESDVSSHCCTYREVFTRTLAYYLAKVKPEVNSEYIYSSVGGNYNFGFSGRRKYVLQESQGKLVAPMIIYNRHSANFESWFVNSLLQTDFFSGIATGDTVALMEYQILFEK